MGEPNNGQPLSQPDHPKPKRHNAKHCTFAIRQRIVNALANGDSIRAIARVLHVSNNTVVAIREQEWQQVETRKARIAAQSERNATRAAELIAEKLEGEDAPLSVLVPVFGVSVDKMLALRGDSSLSLNVNHHHLHEVRQSHRELCDALLSAHSLPPPERPIPATVVETRQLAKKTPRKSRLIACRILDE